MQRAARIAELTFRVVGVCALIALGARVIRALRPSQPVPQLLPSGEITFWRREPSAAMFALVAAIAVVSLFLAGRLKRRRLRSAAGPSAE